MIIVHYWKNIPPEEPTVRIVGIVNDSVCIYGDTDVIDLALANAEDFEPETEVLYTVYLQRAVIASAFPLSEPYFEIVHFTKMKKGTEIGEWQEPVFQF
jgi:hypothetical protein